MHLYASVVALRIISTITEGKTIIQETYAHNKVIEHRYADTSGIFLNYLFFGYNDMKKNFRLFLVVGLVLSVTGNVHATTVHYESSQLDGNRWKYDYSITNDTLASNIQEFTISFDYGLYDNLTVVSPLTDWSQLVTNPALIFGVPDNGTYDALALNLGITPGATMTGFSVSFDWLGAGTPGSQYFEIVDPVSFNTLDSGYTIPEPSTFMLLSLSLTGLISISRLAKKPERNNRLPN